mmetsp:Transcript_9946/g.24279  ORF Transcript_9946/g.24279 Transcript_9946/m.24279 type:complete len:201 (-) Transcript_9946:34-636(-)
MDTTTAKRLVGFSLSGTRDTRKTSSLFWIVTLPLSSTAPLELAACMSFGYGVSRESGGLEVSSSVWSKKRFGDRSAPQARMMSLPLRTILPPSHGLTRMISDTRFLRYAAAWTGSPSMKVTVVIGSAPIINPVASMSLSLAWHPQPSGSSSFFPVGFFLDNHHAAAAAPTASPIPRRDVSGGSHMLCPEAKPGKPDDCKD